MNADDFGYSGGVNDGIIKAHEHGLVTSASLMVDEPAAAAAAAYARGRAGFSVGLHVDLRRGRVRLRWPGRRTAERRLQPRAEELRRQLERFRSLMGDNPTHLDSHKHRHREEVLRPLFSELAAELDVPLRQCDARIRFCGDFYGQVDAGAPEPAAIATQALIELLEQLPPGITELCSHPGYGDDLKTTYRHERAQEVRTLCDPSVRAAIDELGIRLISFRDLPHVIWSPACPAQR